MDSNTACWGALLNECSGPITNEHLLTEALFKRHVIIKGIYAMPDGTCPEWLTKQGLDMSIRSLKAGVLCDYHNRVLGKTADRAAIDLQKALTALSNPMQLPGSRILRAPISKAISGVDYARWLCKTHCNISAANGQVPRMSYVQYAFGKRPEENLHFYTPVQVGQNVRIGRGRINYALYFDKDDPGMRIFEITLCGLRTLVTPFPVDTKTTARLMHTDGSLMDRLVCIQQFTSLGWYRISLDWKDDPCTMANDALNPRPRDA